MPELAKNQQEKPKDPTPLDVFESEESSTKSSIVPSSSSSSCSEKEQEVNEVSIAKMSQFLWDLFFGNPKSFYPKYF